ncbi:uncharacterized protein VTP21DRAFT_10446 [Calcarisporiella thermophila]|uniref:uncharacterized protein n=1 Tax=Calcarisporiella thermophila TaxID=911321 RepID=UPI0037422630
MAPSARSQTSSSLPTTIPQLVPPADITNVPPPAIDSDKKKILERLREDFLESSSIFSSDDKVRTSEISWCSDACLLRYLRACKWNYSDARERIEETLKWRRSYGPHLIDPQEIEEECYTGKIYLNGFDSQGSPVIYMKPRNENTKPSRRHIRNVVFLLERAIRLMPENVEKMVIVVDFAGSSTRTNPGLGIAKEFLTVLGNHYPERLGRAFLVNTPWFFWTFWKLISPFIDPVTRSKIRFVDLKTQNNVQPNQEKGDWANLLHYIPAEQLEADFGGKLDYEFKFDDYWRTLLSTTQEPRCIEK